MDILKDNPNLIFLIFVRNEDKRLFCIKKLRRPIYRSKILKAITVIKVAAEEYIYTFGDHKSLHFEKDSISYWVCGRVYREDGPAYIGPTGNLVWRIDNKTHRTDGPAIIHVDGSQEWHFDGKEHRDASPDGTIEPAYIHINGKKIWFWHGKHHRDGGPAIIRDNGYQAWYLHGKEYSESEFYIAINRKHLILFI